jgi:sugar lactone lactonase YvrE
VEVLSEERAVLGESPLWHRSEELFYWVDIARQLVLRYDPRSERIELRHRGLTVSALCESEGGGLILITPHALLSLRGGQVDKLAPLSLSADVRTNDGKCDPHGRVWFGTMDLETKRPIGELYVFDGRSTQIVQDEVILSNGLGWSPTGDVFYHVDTIRRLIYRHDYDIDTGAVSNREVLVDLTGPVEAPDGLAVDAEGNLWVAMWDGWRIDVFNGKGENIHRESLPVQRPTSVAFGGHDLTQLYVTTATEGLSPDEIEEHPHAGKLLRLDPGTSGLPIGVFPLNR